MDITGLEGLVDRYGGDLTHWPTPERGKAEMLLATSPEARLLLREMQEIEIVLRATAAADDTAAIDHIATRATRHTQETRTHRFVMRAGVGTAAAAVLALGVLVGGLLAPPGAHDMNADRVLAAALDSGGAVDVE